MKKVDEATGMTIEVPGHMTTRGKFPYAGFWAAVYPQLVRGIQKYCLPNENTSTINEALSNLINLTNGEQAIILSERLWYIGELMEINPTLAVEGRAGLALGYVQPSKDGGRLAVASRLFDAPIRAIIAQTGGKTRADNSMSNLLNEQSYYKTKLEQLTIQLRNLEREAGNKQEIAQLQQRATTIQNQIIGLQKECDKRAEQIAEIQAVRVQYASVKKTHDAEQAEVKKLQNQIKNLPNNNARRENATKALAPLLQRVQSTGMWLQRVAVSADDSVIGDLQSLQNSKLAEINRLTNEYNNLVNTYNSNAEKYETAVASGQQVWLEMQQVSNHIQSMESNIANATNAMSSFNNIETSQLTRVWVAHLANCRSEAERLLFQAKANAMGAVQGSPIPRSAEELVDAMHVKHFEEYIDVLNQIGDSLDDAEYELLEEIGRLGLAMAYVPEGNRLYAISELRKSRRTVAYRNLIEEILAQGGQPDMDKKIRALSAGGRTLLIENDNDLVEVKHLIRHLTDSKLNLKYGGGN